MKKIIQQIQINKQNNFVNYMGDVAVLIFFLGCLLYLIIKRPSFWDKNDVHKRAAMIYFAVFFMAIVYIIKIINKFIH